MNSNDDGIKVTDQSFADLLIEGLLEVRAIVRGEVQPARRVVRLPDPVAVERD